MSSELKNPTNDVEEDAEAVERIARRFHETYERLAPEHGYETRKDSAVSWEAVPEQNKGLMCAVVAELLEEGVVAVPSKPTHDERRWVMRWCKSCGRGEIKTNWTPPLTHAAKCSRLAADVEVVEVVPAVVARERERERDEARGHVRHFEQRMNEWQDAWMEQRDRAERAERAADALAEGLRPFARIAERNPGIAAPEYERARDLLAEHGPLTADEEHARNAGWSDGFMDFGYPDEHGEKGSNES